MVAFVYLLGNLALACVLGCAFIRILSDYSMPSLCKFLIGFSVLPYVLGLYMLLISIVPWKMSNCIYVGIPYLIAILYMYLEWRRRGKAGSLIPQFGDSEENAYLELVMVGIITSLESGIVTSKTVSVVGFIVVVAVSVIILALIYRILATSDNMINQNRFYVDLFYIVLIELIERVYFIKWNNRTEILISVAILLIVAGGIMQFYFYRNQTNRAADILGVYGFIFCIVALERHRRSLHNTTVGIMSFVLLAGLLTIIIIRIKSEWRKTDWRTLIRSYTKEIVTFVSLCLLFFIIRYIMITGINAVTGSDAIQYLSEALEYAQDIRFGMMNDFHGNSSGTLLANIHSPVWPAYLSNGLMYSSQMGYPDDYGARMAFAMTFVFFLCSLFSLGCYVKNKLVGILSCVLFFTNISMLRLVDMARREGFRFVPLIVFTMLLLGAPGKLRIKNSFPLLFSCMCIMIGHPINAITAISIFLAYTIIEFMLNKDRMGKILKISIICMWGALIGSYQIIFAFLETGSVTGGLIDFEDLLSGTSYYNTYVAGIQDALGSNLSFARKLFAILSMDKGVLFIPAIIASVFLLHHSYKVGRSKAVKEMMLTIIVLIQFVMLTDIFSWSGRSYVDWCYKNFRYTSQMYFFYSLVISVLIYYLISDFGNSKVKSICAVTCGAYLAMAIIIVYKPLLSIIPAEDRSERYDMVEEIIDHTSGYMLLDNYNMNYYLNNQGLCFWTQPLDELRRANTNEEFYSLVRKMNISSILITKQYWDLYWRDTELERFVSSDDYISSLVNIPNDEKTKYTVYMIKGAGE